MELQILHCHSIVPRLCNC